MGFVNEANQWSTLSFLFWFLMYKINAIIVTDVTSNLYSQQIDETCIK